MLTMNQPTIYKTIVKHKVHKQSMLLCKYAISYNYQEDSQDYRKNGNYVVLLDRRLTIQYYSSKPKFDTRKSNKFVSKFKSKNRQNLI